MNTFSLEQVKELLKKRIEELNKADAAFCADRWNPEKSILEQKLARENSNEVTFARQELESILEQLPNTPVLSAEEASDNFSYDAYGNRYCKRCGKIDLECNCVTSDNKASAPVASHTASFCNSLEQMKKEVAYKIEAGMLSKGWNKTKFAAAMGVNNSIITKWLSGSHNFTVDTIFNIEESLNIKILQL